MVFWHITILHCRCLNSQVFYGTTHSTHPHNSLIPSSSSFYTIHQMAEGSQQPSSPSSSVTAVCPFDLHAVVDDDTGEGSTVSVSHSGRLFLVDIPVYV